MSTKAILAGLAGGIFAFFGGWLVYGILLMDYFMANTPKYEGLMKDPPDFIFIAISNLAWGFLYALIFHRWAKVNSIAAGFKKGLAISFLVILSFDTSMYAFYNLSTIQLVAIDIVIGTLFGGAVGGVVGAVLGTGK